MNIFKRAILNITRHPGKSLAVLLVTITMSCFLSLSTLIGQSCNNVRKDFLYQTGLKVTIEQGEERPNYEAIAELVAYLDAWAKRFSYYDICLYQDVSGHFKTAEEDLHNIRVYTTSQVIISDELTLSQGRYFNDDELANGRNVVLVNEELLNQEGEGYQIGDEISFILGDGKTPRTYEVVGLYHYNEDASDNILMFVPYKVLVLWADQGSGSPHLHSINIRLNNERYNDELIEDLNGNRLFRYRQFTYSSSSDIYAKVAAPIESLAAIADLILYLSLIATVALLSIISFIHVRDERYEFGVLMAMGEKRWKIILGLFLQMFLMATVGFIIGSLLATLMADGISQILIANSMENNFVTAIGSISFADIEQNYEVVYSLGHFMAVYLLMSYVTLVATVLPGIYVARLNIRKLLI